jgi:hypothetical protein
MLSSQAQTFRTDRYEHTAAARVGVREVVAA